MNMISNCISVKAHAGDAHDCRNHLFLFVDILGRVVTILDKVVPVVVHFAPDFTKDYLSGHIIERDFKTNAFTLCIMML